MRIHRPRIRRVWNGRGQGNSTQGDRGLKGLPLRHSLPPHERVSVNLPASEQGNEVSFRHWPPSCATGINEKERCRTACITCSVIDKINVVVFLLRKNVR